MLSITTSKRMYLAINHVNTKRRKWEPLLVMCIYILSAIKYEYLASRFLIDTELPLVFWFCFVKSEDIWLFFF
jgi:hypothetical protein